MYSVMFSGQIYEIGVFTIFTRFEFLKVVKHSLKDVFGRVADRTFFFGENERVNVKGN